jgi:hypothetical protein
MACDIISSMKNLKVALLQILPEDTTDGNLHMQKYTPVILEMNAD